MNNTSSFRKLFKGSILVFGGNILIYFIGFIYHIPVVRILGPEKYGIWGLCYTIVSILAALSIAGLHIGTIYFLSKHKLTYNDKSIGGILKSSFLIALISTSLVTFGLLIFTLFGVDKIYSYPGLQNIMLIMCFAIPFIAFSRLSEAVFQAFTNVDAAYKIKLVPDLFKFLIIPIVLVITKGNLIFMASLTLIAFVLPFSYAGYLINKLIIPLKHMFVKDNYKSHVRKIIKYSWPLSLNEYASILSERIDVLFIGFFLTGASVGIYKVTIIFSSIVRFIPIALAYLLFPLLNKLFTDNKNRESYLLANRTYKYMIYFNLPVLCFIIIFAQDILIYIYGTDFIIGTIPLIFLSLAIGIEMFAKIPANLLVLKEKTKTLLYISIFGIGLNVIGNYILIPKYALSGAAFATFLSTFITMMLIIIFSSITTNKFVFPWKAIGVPIATLLVIILSLNIRERSFVFNIGIYAMFLGIIIIWGSLFERNELRQGWNIIKKRVRYS
jgi:stage V sporulation protein B